MSVNVVVGGDTFALPTSGEPYWRPSVTEWAQEVSNQIAAGGGFSVLDTSTIDLTLSGGVLSADIVAGSITNAMINASAAISLSKLAGSAGSNQQIFFNDSGVLGADADLTWNKTTNLLTILGSLTTGADAAGHDVKFYGDTSGLYAEYEAETNGGCFIVHGPGTDLGYPYPLTLKTEGGVSYFGIFNSYATPSTGGAFFGLSVPIVTGKQ